MSMYKNQEMPSIVLGFWSIMFLFFFSFIMFFGLYIFWLCNGYPLCTGNDSVYVMTIADCLKMFRKPGVEKTNFVKRRR